IDDLIEERYISKKRLLFVVDDHFFGVRPRHAEWAKELLRQRIKRGNRRPWFCQTTSNMGEAEEGLRLAYKAGCRGMMIGFGTFSRETLRDYPKGINRNNVDRYKELIDGFHRAGISVFGGFIIGADQDDEETVAETALQAVQAGVDTIQITNLKIGRASCRERGKMYEVGGAVEE